MIRIASKPCLAMIKRMTCGLVIVAFTGGALHAVQDELARRASWDVDNGKRVVEASLEWLAAQDTIDDAQREQMTERLRTAVDESPDTISRVLLTVLGRVDGRIGELIETCSRPRSAAELTEVIVLSDGTLPEWVRANLRLHYGVWLANQALYDEAHEQLTLVSHEDVANPASLLFYRAIVQHRRLEKTECLETIDKLLENEEFIPRRFSTVAKLMQADIEPLEPDSLDEIARIMDSIKVRLQHGRAGTRVRQEEEDVIAKLDKLIEKLEQQAQSSSSSSSSSNGGSAPGEPMQDSAPGGVQGPGNVAPRELGADTNWGDLPPKEREEALQQLGRDLPSHYRDVIEQYFRKLSQDEN